MSATSGDAEFAHVALLPSAGMGHLTPFLCLASTLASHGCRVTFIAIHPTVSSAESVHLSALFSAYPQIHPLEFPLLHFDGVDAKSADSFYLHCESIRRSAHLLPPLLTSLSPPPSSFVVDISLASAFIPIAKKLDLPSYVLFTSSATMLTLFAYLPGLIADAKRIDNVVIPGMQPLPASMIPPALHDPTNLFTTQFVDNGRALLHGAVGAFVSHCGWNSVVEAAARGVRVLAWPRGADQRVNAGLVERSGLGVWAREWGWDGEEEGAVRGEEIGRRVRELMGNTRVGECVARVSEEALRAAGVGGSSYKGLVDLFEKWRA